MKGFNSSTAICSEGQRKNGKTFSKKAKQVFPTVTIYWHGYTTNVAKH
jgi:hypothetical protein